MDKLSKCVVEIPDLNASFIAAMGKLQALRAWLDEVKQGIKDKTFRFELSIDTQDPDLVVINDDSRNLLVQQVVDDSVTYLLRELESRYRMLVNEVISDFYEIMKDQHGYIFKMHLSSKEELYEDPLKFYNSLIEADKKAQESNEKAK